METALITEFHKNLANYFASKPLYQDEPTQKKPNVRKLLEQSWQLYNAEENKQLSSLLLSFDWLQAKLIGLDIDELTIDFDYVSDSLIHRLICDSLQLSSSVLRNDPKLLAGQLKGRLLWIDKQDITSFLSQVRPLPFSPWFNPRRECLCPPGGALIKTLEGHESSISSIGITPNGNYLVSGSGTIAWEIGEEDEDAEKTFKLWELSTGKNIRTFEEQTSSVVCLAISPNNHSIVSGLYDGLLKVWDINSGYDIRVLNGRNGFLTTCIAISSNGEFAVTGSTDSVIRLWNLVSGENIRNYFGHKSSVKCVAISPDSRFIVSGSVDKTVKVWDVKTGAEIRTFTGHERNVTCIAISHNGQYIASGSWDNTVKIWNLYNVDEFQTLRGHNDSVECVTFTPNGQSVLSGSRDMTIKEWEFPSGREIRTFEGHNGWINCIAITPDSHYAISGSDDKTIKIWNVSNKSNFTLLSDKRSFLTCLTITPDGQFAVFGSYNKTLTVWDLNENKVVRNIEEFTDMVWSPVDGQLHQTQDRVLLLVNCITITPDGQFAICGTSEDTLRVWKISTGEEVKILERTTNIGNCVTITRDGRFVFASSTNNKVWRWELATAKAILSFEEHSSSITGIVITPDGLWGISGALFDDGKALKVWEVLSGKEIRTLQGHVGVVRCIIITSDGHYVISGSDDKTIKIWDIYSGSEIKTLKGHKEEVTCLCITPDNQFVISGSKDKTLILWELATGDLISSYVFECKICNCHVTPDGKSVIVGVGTLVAYLDLELYPKRESDKSGFQERLTEKDEQVKHSHITIRGTKKPWWKKIF
jgi:WD40 repeat protein